MFDRPNNLFSSFLSSLELPLSSGRASFSLFLLMWTRALYSSTVGQRTPQVAIRASDK